ncbi:sulfate/molybdate ABC transporter ATP-binding protein [Phreatobacter aquaticus]|uniref:Sulfate/molybdate ABC transporter ATP-binding protein n=1 Tax=Phreatobacter aquaticus TaxID=2570229 RepID=A0A4D7QJN0_9HYPH|nr:sulfate/molybdate ABC transporter ATP-binding protein [Phreatobacter aquaticus]QCK84542.1 sulfate/molybdate ABC transporter ATP-binding protein [Phreatobacter aquaticus]
MLSQARAGIEAGEAVAIHVEGLTKSFNGGAPALDGIDLDVRPGELLALLGPSGSGKTTLLRVVAGLEPISSGRVLFDAQDATELSVQERRVGFVFQHYALFRHMRVADNIAYGLKVRPRASRPSTAEIRERVSNLIDLVQLTGLGRRFPGQLSGGQRQRVALARALAVDPRVLLLDEPFGALDAQVRRDLRRWLREIHDRTGHTTLFVTHDQDEALELADRVAILNKGRIEQVGTPDEIYDHPATAFVASFIGEAVRIPVEVGEDGVIVGGQTLDAPEVLIRGAADWFVRPGDFQVADGAEPALEAQVVAVRRTGAGRRVEIALADDLPRIDITLEQDRPVAVGDRLRLRPRSFRLFAR